MMNDGSFVTAGSDTLTACYNLTDGALIGRSNGSMVAGPPYRVLDDPQNIPPNFDPIKSSSSELFYTLYTCKPMFRVKNRLI